MECCGTPFAIGDTIKWLVMETEQLNIPVDVGKINYCYEAHSSDWHNIFILEGKVEAIKILYQLYASSESNPRLLIPVSGKVFDADTAKGFEKKLEGMKASGHIVALNEYVMRPAKKEEVTFK